MKIHEVKINKLHAASALTWFFSFSLPRICYRFSYQELILSPPSGKTIRELIASSSTKNLSPISTAVLPAH